MKKKTLLLTYASCLLLGISVNAQQKDSVIFKQTQVVPLPVESSDKVQVDFYGFIRSDIFYDTRQGIGAGENVVSLYPRDRMLDANGEDINAAGKFHMLSVISRAGITLKGPEVMGAKTSGILEGEFFGATEGGINEFRLRHAYIMFDWEKTQVGVGQYWHPFVVLEALPNVVNYGTGAPVYGLNRNPQIRVTHKITPELRVIAAIHSQRDFTPNNEPFRNSALPAAHLQLQYKTANFVAGIGGQYENLKPKLSSGTPVLKSNERVESFSGMAYVKAVTKPVTVTAAAYLMQDASTFVMLGGIAGYQKPGEVETYKPINTQSFWIDLQQNATGRWSTGVFAGLVKNKGVDNPIEGAVATTYGVTTNWGAISASQGGRTVNELFKVVPRLDFSPHKAFKFRLEAEYSQAEWADATNRAIGYFNKYDASNLRLHLTTTFSF